jgi:hypothetical protein
MKIFGLVLAIFLIAGTAMASGKAKVTVQILTPTSNQHATTPAFVISGSAHASGNIAEVFYELNSDGWVPASLVSGGKSWYAVVTLTPGTNTLSVYAQDTAGNVSSTDSVKFFYDLAPASLIGMTAYVTNGPTTFVLSFGTNTFSMGSDDNFDNNGAGTYTYSKINSVEGKASLIFKAPPTLAKTNSVLYLQFTANNSGWFTNAGGTDFFTFTNIPTLVATPPLDNIVLDDDSGGETVLVFPPPSTILNNGFLFKVRNPFPIPLDAAYPGNIGDRVSVDLAHYGFSVNRWNFINAVKDSGTVLTFGINSSGTNTVIVLFDIAPFITSKDAFIPEAGGLVNVLTFYYTNEVDGTVTPGGVFTYTNYSPIGALLTTGAADSTNYYILTFTNTGYGDYASESVDSSGLVNTNSGAFNLTFTLGGGETNLVPASVAGEILVTTNSIGFFESVGFLDDTTFTETNSFNIMTNSSGNYIYTSNSLDEATVELDFTSGPTSGLTNFIYTTFTNTDSGTFHTDMLDSSGNTNNSINGIFILEP